MTRRAPQEDRAGSWLPRLLGAGLAGAVLVLFLPCVRYEFTNYDEDGQIVENPLVRSLAPRDVARMFTRFSITNYYPVRLLSFAVDYRFWGFRAGGYHLTNVCVHAANVLLLFWLIGRILDRDACAGPHGEQTRRAGTSGADPRRRAARWWVAGLGAGLFAVHPVVVEPVAWIAGREELLMVFFALVSLHAFAQGWPARGEGDATGPAGRARTVAWRLLSVGAAACACMSNVVGVVLALLTTAYAVLVAGKRRAGLLLACSLPVWLLAVAAVVVKKAGDAQAAARGMVMDDPGLHLGQRILTALSLYGLNLRTLLWPKTLYVIYPQDVPQSALAGGVLIGALLALATGAALWRWRHRPAVAFGLLWFLAALAPCSQLIPHHIFRADRFLYLPLAGLAVALAGMGRLPAARAATRRVLAAAAGAALAACFVRSHIQRPVWRDTATLFTHTLKHNPKALVALNNLGNYLAKRGDPQRAIGYYRAALRINPDFVLALNSYGNALSRQGRLEEAIGQYSRALQLNARSKEAHNNLGTVFMAMGRLDAATTHYRAALDVDPYDPEVHSNLGVALVRGGAIETGLQHYAKALAIDPLYPGAHYNFGLALFRAGRMAEAVAHFSAALRQAPHDADIHNSLANALAGQGNTSAAVAHYSAALRIKPGSARIHNNLAVVLAGIGQVEQALEHQRQALRIEPDYAESHYNLGALLLEQGRTAEAIVHLSRAAVLRPEDPRPRDALARTLRP
ncbi:MAG: tetratricopeptide repeat protein [Kiritimatiellae bacterium]|nr:tetratricopeptide repeat protein [Kiritimatiellia bacterium]